MLAWRITGVLAYYRVPAATQRIFSWVACNFPPSSRWCHLVDLVVYIGPLEPVFSRVQFDYRLVVTHGFGQSTSSIPYVNVISNGLSSGSSDDSSTIPSIPPTPGRSLSPLLSRVIPDLITGVDAPVAIADQIEIDGVDEIPIADELMADAQLESDVDMVADTSDGSVDSDGVQYLDVNGVRAKLDPNVIIIDCDSDIVSNVPWDASHSPVDDPAELAGQPGAITERIVDDQILEDVVDVVIPPSIEILSDVVLNIPVMILVTFNEDGSVTRDVAVDYTPITPTGIPRVLPIVTDAFFVDGPTRVMALWADFARFRWQYHNLNRNMDDCISDLVVFGYAANEPGNLPTRPSGYTDPQWTGIRFWLVIWWVYAYPSTFSVDHALHCLGQTYRNRLFVSVFTWACHYGPGHFEWYYPFTWLDFWFRTPFNHIGPGDYGRLRIPRNLFLLAQHRLLAKLLGDRNASRDDVIAHQSVLF